VLIIKRRLDALDSMKYQGHYTIHVFTKILVSELKTAPAFAGWCVGSEAILSLLVFGLLVSISAMKMFVKSQLYAH
jgi:hypothetical protein